MPQAATIIAFPGVSLPAKPRRRRLTKSDYDNTLLFEALQLTKWMRKCADALDQRVEELKARNQ